MARGAVEGPAGKHAEYTRIRAVGSGRHFKHVNAVVLLNRDAGWVGLDNEMDDSEDDGKARRGENQMVSTEPRAVFPTPGRDAMLLLLTWAAGGTDAISYLALGRVFTAMMTGNTVLLALALGEGEIRAVLRSLLALGGFVTGAAVGALILQRDDRRADWPVAVTATLACETLVLGFFEAMWQHGGAAIVHVLIACSGVAMGMQAIAVRRLGVPGVATTYITGTITSLVGDLVVWLSAPGPGGPSTQSGDAAAAGVDRRPDWESRVGLLGGVFLAYGLGALVGGVLLARASPLATLSPLIAVALVVANAALRHRYGRD